MIISIIEARQIMGKVASRKYKDSEIEELINGLSLIANFAIDSYIEMKRKQKQEGGDKAKCQKESLK